MATTINCKDLELPLDERKWYYFIITSLSLYFGGLLVITCSRVLIKLFEKKPTKTSRVTPPPSAKSRKSAGGTRTKCAEDDGDTGLYVDIKEGAGSLITAKTMKGQVLVRSICILLAFFSLSTYIYFFISACSRGDVTRWKSFCKHLL